MTRLITPTRPWPSPRDPRPPRRRDERHGTREAELRVALGESLRLNLPPAPPPTPPAGPRPRITAYCGQGATAYCGPDLATPDLVAAQQGPALRDRVSSAARRVGLWRLVAATAGLLRVPAATSDLLRFIAASRGVFRLIAASFGVLRIIAAYCDLLRLIAAQQAGMATCIFLTTRRHSTSQHIAAYCDLLRRNATCTDCVFLTTRRHSSTMPAARAPRNKPQQAASKPHQSRSEPLPRSRSV